MMNRLLTTVWIMLMFVFLWACSTEELVSIDGDYMVTFWERVGCLDSLSNFRRDLDSTGCITNNNGKFCYNYTFSFIEGTSFAYDLRIDSNGLVSNEQGNGVFALINSHMMSYCTPQCDTITFIPGANSLELIFPADSINGCGTYLKMESI